MENLEKSNYILPETEKTIREMISKTTKAFDFIRILCGALYLVFLSLRVFFFSNILWLDIFFYCIFFISIYFFNFRLQKQIQYKENYAYFVQHKTCSIFANDYISLL